jgi:hypothetical protein
MYARRHFLVRNEVALLRQGKLGNKEQTSLLLFSVLLESNEEDLIYVMMQEGVHRSQDSQRTRGRALLYLQII